MTIALRFEARRLAAPRSQALGGGDMFAVRVFAKDDDGTSGASLGSLVCDAGELEALRALVQAPVDDRATSVAVPVATWEDV